MATGRVGELEQLHEVGLLVGLTRDALKALLAEVEVAAARERELDPDGDDPRNLYDRWLDQAFYLYLAEAGPKEGVLTSRVSPAELTSLLAGKGPAKLVFEASPDTRAGKKVRVSFPGSSPAPLDVLCASAGDLAGVANFALAKVDDPRRFVECQIDPRFQLNHLETVYLLASLAQRVALVDLGIIRDDEEVTDVVEPIAGPAQSFLRVRGFGGTGTGRLQTSVLAMPRGGKWHIQGSWESAPPGPMATNLTGEAYAQLYEISGWRPRAEATANTFTVAWDMKPGVFLAVLDGGDDADLAPDRVRAALDELKLAANGAGTDAPVTAVESTEVALVTAQIAADQLLVRRHGSAMALVVRDGEAFEPGKEPMPLEPGDTVMLGSHLDPVTSKQLVAVVEQVSHFDEKPVSLLLARASEGTGIRPALLIAHVALKPPPRW